MNHIYKSVWSEALNVWVAVSEINSAKGKKSHSSKKRKNRSLNHTAFKGIIFALGVSLTQAVWAQGSWVGGVDQNWGSSGNWSNNQVPDAAGESVIFDSSTTTSLDGSTIVLGTNRTLGTLSFDGPGSSTTHNFKLSGNRLNFDNNGSAADLVLNGNLNVTIDSALLLNNGSLNIKNQSAWGGSIRINGAIAGGGQALNVDVVSPSSKTTLSGSISGAGTALTKTGSGTLTLSGNNSFTGGVSHSGGTLELKHNNTLGSGVLSFTSGSAKNITTTGSTISVSNGLELDSDLNMNNAGKLSFNGSYTTAIGSARTMYIDTGATLAFGANHSLTGGTLAKSGFGTLELNSGNNAFSALNVTAGNVISRITSGNLTIGSASAGTNYLGTGDITIRGSDTVLTVEGTAGSTVVDFAGGTVLLDGGTLAINNADVSLTAGTIDFGSGATKGKLNFDSNVSLGNLTFLNTLGAAAKFGRNVTFLTGATFPSSGIDISFNGTGDQLIDAQAAGASINVNGILSKEGTGTATLGSNISNLNLAQDLNLIAGTFDLGAVSTLNVFGTVNLTGGSLLFGKDNQYNGSLTTIGNGSKVLLNGFNQNFNNIQVNAGQNILFDLGNFSSLSTILNLGAVNNNGVLRIKNWSTGSFSDQVLASSVSDPSDVWFYGYNKGASYVGGELRPNSGFLTTEFDNTVDGSGAVGTWKWNTSSNWVGDDEFYVPNAPGVTVNFKNAAGSLASKTIDLENQTITVGSLIFDSSATVSGNFTIGNSSAKNGTIIFDSGVAGQPAVFQQIKGAGYTLSPILNAKAVLVSDLLIDVNTYFGQGSSSIISGSGAIIVRVTNPSAGSGTTYLTNDVINTYSGGTFLERGYLSLKGATGSVLGTGALTVQQDANDLTADSYTKRSILGYGSARYTVNNQLIWDADLTASAITFNYNGNVALDGTRTLFVGGTATDNAQHSVIFGSNLNLIDDGLSAGGIVKLGNYGLRFDSQNNTFSGGLTVGAGTVYSVPTTDLVLGQLSANNNYLGSGAITVNGDSSGVTVGQIGSIFNTMSHGSVDLNSGGTMTIYSDGSLNLAAGSTFNSSTVNGGSLINYGDLLFDGGAINNPQLVMDTSSLYNTDGTSVIRATAGNGNVVLGGSFTKRASGVTRLDSSITSFSSGTGQLNLTGGIFQLGANNQLANNQSIVLNGGALDVAGYRNSLDSLYLRGNSSLLLGNNGGLTFNTRQIAAGDWYADKILTIQNSGTPWLASDTGAYVRFLNQPFTIGSDNALLANIAFTGYETGAIVNYDGAYYYLLPNGVLTNEWGGSANPDNTWGNASNWLTAVVPNSAGASATIRDADPLIAGKTIDVDANYTIGRLNIESNAGTLTLGGAGTLTFQDDGTTPAHIKHYGSSVLTLATQTNIFSPTEIQASVSEMAGYLRWTGEITGSGTLSKIGGGTLRLSQNNANWTGGLNWHNGLLQVASDEVTGTGLLTIGDVSGAPTLNIEALGADRTISSAFVLNSGLFLRRGTELGAITNTDNYNLTLNGDGTLASGEHLVGSWGNNTLDQRQNLIFGGVLSGEGGLKLTDNGQVTLTKTNTFTGGVVLGGNWGRIYADADNALGSGTITLNGGRAFIGSNIADSLSNSLELNNLITTTANATLDFDGTFNFNNIGTSTINHKLGIAVSGNKRAVFGANHILAGTGSFSLANSVKSSYGGRLRMEGQNTFSGGFTALTNYTLLEIGSSSTKDASGNLISGPLGTGAFTLGGNASLYVYSPAGSGITEQVISNQILFGTSPYFSVSSITDGDAKTLVFDTETINFNNTKGSHSISVANGTTLRIESQLLDGSGIAAGFTKSNVGTLELTNGDNQISDGAIVALGALTGRNVNGNIVTGRLSAGENMLGVGALVADGVSSQINLISGGDVYLSGSGVTLNNGGKLNITAGTTWLDSNSIFGGSGAAGRLTSSGSLVKTGVGTTTEIGAQLAVPQLDIQQGTIRMTADNLMSGVNALNLSGGMLELNGTKQVMGSSGNAAITMNSDSAIGFGGTSAWLSAGSLNMSNYNLTIEGWNGNSNTGLGVDRFIFTNGTAGTVYENVLFTGGYGIGAMLMANGDGQLVLVPTATAFVWNGQTDSLWGSSNWQQYDPASETTNTTVRTPIQRGDAVTFNNEDSALNGKTITVAPNTVIGSISFESTEGQSFTLSGNSITFDRAGETSNITVTGDSSATIESDITLKYNLLASAENDLVINHLGTGLLTLAGNIEGINRYIDKVGSGTLALMGGGSTFTNGFNMMDGTLQIGADSAVTASNVVVSGPLGIGTFTWRAGNIESVNGAHTIHNTLDLSGNLALSGSNDLSFAGTTATISANTNLDVVNTLTLSIGNALSGSSELVKTGTGTLELNGNNSAFSGDITLNAGVLAVGSITANPTHPVLGTGALNITGNATLTTDSSAANDVDTIANNITISPSVTVTVENSNTTDLALTGDIDGDGSIIKTGTGIVALNSDNTYTGQTFIDAGTLVLGHVNGASSGNITINGSGTDVLRLSFDGISGTYDAQFDNVLSGSGGTRVTGTDIAIAANNSSYTGNWLVEGSMRITSANNLGSGNVALASGVLSVAGNADYNFANQLSGTGVLDIDNNNTDTQFAFVTGAQGGNFSGSLNVNTGTLSLDTIAGNTTDGVLKDATVNLNANGQIDLVGSQTVGALTLNGGILQVDYDQENITAGSIEIKAATEIKTDIAVSGSYLSQDDGITATIAQSGATPVVGNINNLSLQGATSATTNIIDVVQGSDTVADPTAKLIYGYVFEDTYGGNNGIYLTSSLNSVEIQNGKTFTLAQTAGAGAEDFKAQITNDASSTGNLVLQGGTVVGDSMTLTPTGAYTYSGTTKVDSGLVILGTGVANMLANSSAIEVVGGATLQLNDQVQKIKQLSGAGEIILGTGAVELNNILNSAYSGIFSGSAAVNKTGAGTLTLGGNSTNYSGSTTINAGRLVASASNALGMGAAIIDENAVLELGTGVATFANQINHSTTGIDGTIEVSGNNSNSGIAITGNNTGFSGMWDIKSSGIAGVVTAGNLGSASVHVDGALNINSTTPYSMGNALSGSGIVNVFTGSITNAFGFTATANNGFTGILRMQQGVFTMDGHAQNTLANATLRLDNNSSTSVDAAYSIGTLDLAGGTYHTVADTSLVDNAPYILTVDTLQSSAAGSKIAADSALSGISTTGELTGSIFDLDGTLEKQIIAATTLGTGAASGTNYTVVDELGNTISPTGTKLITDGSATTLGEAKYRYTAKTGTAPNGAGLYLGYGLDEIESTHATSAISINSVSSTDKTLGVLLSGSGAGFTFEGGETITLARASGNTYTGKTVINDVGTQIIFGADNSFGQTSELSFGNGTSVNMVGFDQTVGALNTVANSALILNGSDFTVSHDRGVTTSAIAGENVLRSGTGISSLNFTSGTATVSGANTNLTSNTTVNLENTTVLNINGTTVLGNAFTGLGMANINVGTGAVFNLYSVSGNVNNILSGEGRIVAADGNVNITLAADNAGFTGIWDLDVSGAQMTLTNAQGLGSASVIEMAAGTTLNLNVATADSFVLSNVAGTVGSLSGAGQIQKTGTGTVTLAHANTGFTGQAIINNGTLKLQADNALGSADTEFASSSATLELANEVTTYTAELSSNNAGDGIVLVSGNASGVGVTLTADNATAGFSGKVQVAEGGILNISNLNQIGTSNTLVQLDAGLGIGQMNVNVANNMSWMNSLTGGGILAINLDNGGVAQAFEFASSAGTAFTGTVKLSNATYDFAAANNINAIGGATLELSQGSEAKISADNTITGNLAFSGGGLSVSMISPNQANMLTVNHLDVDVAGAPAVPGYVDLDVGSLTPGVNPTGNFLDQDNVSNGGIQVVSSSTVSSENKLLDLTLNGTAPADQSVTVSDGVNNDIIATYGYSAVTTLATSSLDTGLYVDYILKQLETQTELIIDNSGANSTVLGAKITGVGDVTIQANSSSITLNNAGNDYTGSTHVKSGKLIAGTGNIFADSSNFVLDAGTSFDTMGFEQKLNNLQGSGNILADQQMTLNNTTDTIFSGELDTGKRLVKTGSGAVDLSSSARVNLAQLQMDEGTINLGQNAIISGGGLAAVETNSGFISSVFFDRSNVSTTGATLFSASNGSTLNLQTYNMSMTGDINATDAGTEMNVRLVDSVYTGAVNQLSGAQVNLDVDPSVWNVSANSVLQNLRNDGHINFITPNYSTDFKTIRVNGSYDATPNAMITLNTYLGGDSSPTDQLIVDGGTTGNTSVVIRNAGGGGAQTYTGIKVIDVVGSSSGVFTLSAPVVAGLYEYKLFEDGGDWYLRSRATGNNNLLRPEIGAYLGNIWASNTMFHHTRYDRTIAATHEQNMWMRMALSRTENESMGGAVSQKTNTSIVHLGFDIAHLKNNYGDLKIGAMGGYGNSKTEARSFANSRSADGSVNGYTLGMYATWQKNDDTTGPYIDTWAQYGWYDNKVSGKELKTENYDSNNIVTSLEAGSTFIVSEKGSRQWLITPHAQVSYVDYKSDSFQESTGSYIHNSSSHGIAGQLGIRVQTQDQNNPNGLRIYGETNIKNGNVGTYINFSKDQASMDLPQTRLEIKAGLEGEIANNWYLHGQIGGEVGAKNFKSYQGSITLKYSF